MVSCAMRALAVTVILGAFQIVTARAQLDLSPQPDSFDLDGIQVSQLTFANGRMSKVSYQPPRDWKCTGQKDQLTIQPAKLSQASARVIKLPEGEIITFDEGGKEQLKRKALLSLPDGNQDVEVTLEQVDPMRIDGLHTYLIELKYVFFGEKFAGYS